MTLSGSPRVVKARRRRVRLEAIVSACGTPAPSRINNQVIANGIAF